jgi:hypothetical protein
LLSKWPLSANSSRLKDVPTEPITVMQSKGNIELFPTTLIESNAMKRLVTLILSAALLCPMWAGAQSTTPSIQGPLHYVGNLVVNYYYTSLPLSAVNSWCSSITDLRLNIQTPNNASPIKAVSGYFNCSTGKWSAFSGTLIATSNGMPNTSNAATTGYTGAFTLGLSQMSCIFPADLSSTTCQLFGVNMGFPEISELIGNATFTYTSAP